MENSFDLLVGNARNANNTENLDALYSAFFELKEWNFIVSQNSSLEDARPFIGLVDEKPWLFVFTDGMKAQQYAQAAGGFLEQDGNTVILRMEAENSMDIARQKDGEFIIIELGDGQVAGLPDKTDRNEFYSRLRACF